MKIWFVCRPETKKAPLLQPSEHALPVMRADYQAMRAMIYGECPAFDELMDAIAEIERDLNSLP